MEVLLKKTKITNSILKQTLRSTSVDFKKGDILGWCLYGKYGKYIVCYRSDINTLSMYPMFKDIEVGESYAPTEGYTNTKVGYWIKVKLGGNYIPITYTESTKEAKDDFVDTLKKAKHLAEIKGQFYI